jgi:NTP pyrophosphatase (non-canonical NTP hydrolase)
MKREESNHILITTTISAMKEKLDEYGWKGNITEMSLTKAILRMQDEVIELAEEFETTALDYKAIRRELADIINFAAAGIVACEKQIFIQEKICKS